MFIDIQKENKRDKRSKKEKIAARDEAARKAGLIKDHRE
jgi:hypothetical protein